MARFANAKAPFLRIADTKGHDTKTIMRDFMIALVPVILFTFYKHGILCCSGENAVLKLFYPLIFMLVGGLSSYMMEAICLFIKYKEARTFSGLFKKLNTSFAFIPGLLLAMILPVYTPIWILVVGCFFATVVGKMVFGGFGQNIFNPALIGYVFVIAAFGGAISGQYFNSNELVDAVASATPLTNLSGLTEYSYDTVVKPYGNLLDFFLGTVPGSLAETSALACLLAYIWLSVRKVIDYRVPLIYVSTVFLITLVIGLCSNMGIWFPTFNVLSGGLMFGAVFMATEPVTGPKSSTGKWMFAVVLGVLTVLFRLVGNMPEGVCTAILVMNFAVLFIDKFAAKIQANGINKQTVKGFVTYLVITCGIIVYTIVVACMKY